MRIDQPSPPLCFYEICRDEAALEAHRQTPHFKSYFEKTQTLAGHSAPAPLRQNLLPSDAA